MDILSAVVNLIEKSSVAAMKAQKAIILNRLPPSPERDRMIKAIDEEIQAIKDRG